MFTFANFVPCQFKAFADDFKLYISLLRSTCILILQGMMLLQSDLDRVCAVANLWNLRLNIGKCVLMRFGACNIGNNLSCSYSIDCKVLDFYLS